MKKIIKFIKNLLIATTIVGLAGIGFYFQKNQILSYQQVEPTVTEVAVVPVDINKVQEAKTKLEAAKKLLNEEESTLLAEVKERETRLEEIRAVRLSFSPAPDQKH